MFFFLQNYGTTLLMMKNIHTVHEKISLCFSYFILNEYEQCLHVADAIEIT